MQDIVLAQLQGTLQAPLPMQDAVAIQPRPVRGE
jgi:hypothetical protein